MGASEDHCPGTCTYVLQANVVHETAWVIHMQSVWVEGMDL
jgi:hypothetical protein